ncbi:MAG: HIT family protein [Phycisphaerae bacterium]
MPDANKNLWAPWRMQYIRSLGDEAKPNDACFFCTYWENPDEDALHHVVWRGEHTMVLMNRFPYTNGHLLVAPDVHSGDITTIDDQLLIEMTGQIKNAVGILKKVVHAHGFNVGYNLGVCAGAGVPGHIHAHIVPRWSGDTNFMAVLGDSRVIPDALDTLYADLISEAVEQNLRNAE